MSVIYSKDIYLYPHPNGQTLRNLMQEKDANKLRQKELLLVSKRCFEIQTGKIKLPRTFDADHICTIHHALFQDVYSWAGKFREVNTYKGMTSFAPVEAIDQYLYDVHRIVDSTQWNLLDKDSFVACASTVFAYLNQAHPFRWGNGPAAKVFMNNLAQLSQFTFDWSLVTPEEWNYASMLSGPDRKAYKPVPDSLFSVFTNITQSASKMQLTALDADFTSMGEEQTIL